MATDGQTDNESREPKAAKREQREYDDDKVREAIRAYVKTGSVTEAGRAVGAPKSTVHGWLNSTKWREYLGQARTLHRARVRSQLEASARQTSLAVQLAGTRLCEVLADPDITVATSQKAANLGRTLRDVSVVSMNILEAGGSDERSGDIEVTVQKTTGVPAEPQAVRESA